ncbi:4-(cytidine 5'-diphospho)-2-C-methyl-D-erythritol kinase [Ciceribacter sp. L1K23]|uniref:4-(cytidine 5'-diphospho)-2-C-methyl-D-erythritol kinase n=1 Tax=Ciceribacter sp. L1K23 TaxID=2820276 RepID=UPI001B83C863|nr:4-(cytidine 5'-diphospho)-2-C-methyl-D-erythritol kinase [Ciceribacter sp. L1K23]MBR0556782.1 4-(cytidine 5'-diphospho)-2-C-methyl-D-erythritol kinase [Ciceribacter sp. L1K23]
MHLSEQGAIRETASAKVNLALHVTGRRADGYHLLDSIVTFAEDGDELVFQESDEDGLRLEGRFGGVLSLQGAGHRDNLVVKARDMLRATLDDTGQPYTPVMIALEKMLPVASGIGGGSADAAATLRGLMRLWNARLDDATLTGIALRLGADVPMCLASVPLRARGIGETLEPVAMPSFPMVLVNPLKAVSTPEVFRGLDRRDNLPIGELPNGQEGGRWISALSTLRNDLETPAVALVQEIAEARDLLRQSEAQLVRMSGSGATCFGLYGDDAAALKAALALSAFKPDWYVLLTRTIAGTRP